MEPNYEGPCYSDVDLIKKALVQAGRPLSLDEIAAFMQRNSGTSMAEAKSAANVALNAPDGLFVRSEQDLWDYQSEKIGILERSIQNLAYKLLHVRCIPCSEGELVNYIQRSKGYSKKWITQELRTLDRDVRFVRIDGAYLLSNWELLNDKVYYFMLDSEVEVEKALEVEEVVRTYHKISDPNVIFAPAVDRRFLLQPDGKISLADSEQPMGHFSEGHRRFIEETIHSKIPTAVDYVENHSHGVTVDEVLKHVYRISPYQRSYELWTELVIDVFSKNQNVKLLDGLWYPSRRNVHMESSASLDQVYDVPLNPTQADGEYDIQAAQYSVTELEAESEEEFAVEFTVELEEEEIEETREEEREEEHVEEHVEEGIEEALVEEFEAEFAEARPEALGDTVTHQEGNIEFLNAVSEQVAATGMSTFHWVDTDEDVAPTPSVTTEAGETTRFDPVVTYNSHEESNSSPAPQSDGNALDETDDHVNIDDLVQELMAMRKKFIEEKARIEQYLSLYEDQLTAVTKKAELLINVQSSILD